MTGCIIGCCRTRQVRSRPEVGLSWEAWRPALGWAAALRDGWEPLVRYPRLPPRESRERGDVGHVCQPPAQFATHGTMIDGLTHLTLAGRGASRAGVARGSGLLLFVAWLVSCRRSKDRKEATLDSISDCDRL